MNLLHPIFLFKLVEYYILEVVLKQDDETSFCFFVCELAVAVEIECALLKIDDQVLSEAFVLLVGVV